MFAIRFKNNSWRAAIIGAAAGAICLGTAGGAQAVTIGLSNYGIYNTGVNVGSNDVDNAWSIVSSTSNPSLPVGSPAYSAATATPGQFPFNGYWVPNSTTSNWITPFNPINSSTDPTYPGTYGYVTQFTLGAVAAGANSLSLQFAADNVVEKIYLNGILAYTGPTNGSNQYASFQSDVISDDLTSGLNTLTFYVENYPQSSGNPSGLNVEFTGISGVSAVPEASTWAMLLIGFAALGFAGYRKSKTERMALRA